MANIEIENERIDINLSMKRYTAEVNISSDYAEHFKVGDPVAFDRGNKGGYRYMKNFISAMEKNEDPITTRITIVWYDFV